MRRALTTSLLSLVLVLTTTALFAHGPSTGDTTERADFLRSFADQLSNTKNASLNDLGELVLTMADGLENGDAEAYLATQAIYKHRISRLPAATMEYVSELQSKTSNIHASLLQKHNCGGDPGSGGGPGLIFGCTPSSCATQCWPDEGFCLGDFCTCF